MMRRLLRLAILGALSFCVWSTAVWAEQTVTLETFNALPVLQQKGIHVTEFQAVDGLYLLAGTRKNPKGKLVPVSLAISRDLRYSFFGRIEESRSGRGVYMHKPMGAYKAQASFSQGGGSRAYFIFTDTDCPWCAKLEAELAKHPLPENVSLYYYLYPVHDGAQVIAKNYYILNLREDAERLSAMRNIMLRGDKAYQQSVFTVDQRHAFDKQLGQVQGLARELAVRGTPAIFDLEGNQYSYKQLVAELWGSKSP